jgi:putative addiction module component (TIGR02574 family)
MVYSGKMSQALTNSAARLQPSSIADQIDYVQSLWDRIAAKPEEVPVPEWHREIINERLAAYRANQDQSKEWEEVEREIAAELSQPNR